MTTITEEELKQIIREVLMEVKKYKAKVQKNKPIKNKLQKNKFRKPKKIRDHYKSKSNPDEEGVKMIQYLQKLVGIDEPYERALMAWRKFSPQDKQKTMAVYNYFVNRNN